MERPQIATHTSHLATLSTLLLSFLPSHLLPHLPAPSAPHGYPSSNTPASAIARRQLFDYPPARHPGQGSTSRLSGALNMVREHYDMTRGAGASGRGYGAGGVGGKKRAAPIDYSIYGDDYPVAGSSSGLTRRDKDRDPALRHPNQYTKKRMQGYASGGPGVGGAYGGGAVSAATTNAAAGLYSSIPSHPLGMTAVEAVKEKRRGADAVAPAMSTSGNGSRAGSAVSGVAGNSMAYQGAQGETDYHMLAYGVPQRAPAKRKVEDIAGASKRRKKGCVPRRGLFLSSS